MQKTGEIVACRAISPLPASDLGREDDSMETRYTVDVVLMFDPQRPRRKS